MTGRGAAADVALAGVGLGALLLGRAPLLVVMAAFAVLATGEAYRLARATGVTPAAGLGLAGSLALLGVAHAHGEDAPVFFPIVIVCVVGLAFVALIARTDRTQVTEGVAFTLLPMIAIGMLAAYVIALRAGREGFRVVLALALMAIVNDLVSGLVDPRRGKRAFAPTLRPSRTWEGLAAGAVATMIVAVIVAATMTETFSFASALLLGAAVSAAAPIGDLSRAMLERDLRSEADGPPLARATVWRRVDGLLFAAPVFFYLFRALER